MKMILSLILAVVTLLSLAACADKTETRYILTDFETTMSDGTVQKTVHHYTDDWIMTGSTVYRDGEVEMEIVCELNDRGDPKSITYTMGDLVQAEEYVSVYDDNGNITHTDIYTDGEKTASTTTQRTYDENGVLTSMVQTTANHIQEYHYNPDGTIAKMVWTLLDMNTTQTTEYTYDEQGNEIRTASYNGSGVLISESNSSYDDQGHILVSVDTRYNDDGTPAETSAAEYTWEGLVKTTHVINPDGTETSWAVTEYDQAGNIIRHEIYSGDRLMSSQVMNYITVEVPAE